MIESQLAALFTRMADGEPAASRVDTQLAHRRGRARLRWRRAGLAGTPVLAAAVAVIMALTVGAAPSRPAPRPATGPAAPREFNPLVPYLSFGWLPPGIKLVDGDILRQVVSLDGARKIFDTRDWGLSVYAAGQCHLTAQARSLKCASAAYGLTSKIDDRAPVVRGHRAFWSGYYMIWQYARGGWALLSAPFPNVPYKGPKRVPSIERQAVKIANNVRYGAATPPLVFPFQLTGLPSNWQVSSVFYVPNAGVLQASRWALSSSKPDPGADGGLEYQKNLPYFENIGPAQFLLRLLGPEELRRKVGREDHPRLPGGRDQTGPRRGPAGPVLGPRRRPVDLHQPVWRTSAHDPGHPVPGPSAAARPRPGEMDHQAHRVTVWSGMKNRNGTSGDRPDALAVGAGAVWWPGADRSSALRTAGRMACPLPACPGWLRRWWRDHRGGAGLAGDRRGADAVAVRGVPGRRRGLAACFLAPVDAAGLTGPGAEPAVARAADHRHGGRDSG